jgi:hypothetical protein
MEMDMTTTRRIPLVLAGLFLVGTAACTASPTTTPTATPTTPPVPVCPVGSWTSTGATANTPAGVNITFDGGSGVKLTVGDDGKVKADFSGMKPVTFTALVAGAQVRGEITYNGTTDGTVDLKATAAPTSSTASPLASASASGGPAGASTPTGSPTAAGSGKSGGWHPTGTVNVAALRITVKLTQPIAATILDNAKVTDVTGSQTTQVANAVDLQPLLREGTYRCGTDNNTLTITTSSSPTVVWSLSRA